MLPAVRAAPSVADAVRLQVSLSQACRVWTRVHAAMGSLRALDKGPCIRHQASLLGAAAQRDSLGCRCS